MLQLVLNVEDFYEETKLVPTISEYSQSIFKLENHINNKLITDHLSSI